MTDTERLLREENDTLREELRQLRETMFDKNWRAPDDWKFSPAQTAIFAALLKTERLSLAQLYEITRSSGYAKGDGVNPKVVSVQMCNMRRKLSGRRVGIETLWGFGYRLRPEDRERLRAAA